MNQQQHESIMLALADLGVILFCLIMLVVIGVVAITANEHDRIFWFTMMAPVFISSICWTFKLFRRLDDVRRSYEEQNS